MKDYWADVKVALWVIWNVLEGSAVNTGKAGEDNNSKNY